MHISWPLGEGLQNELKRFNSKKIESKNRIELAQFDGEILEKHWNDPFDTPHKTPKRRIREPIELSQIM